MANGSSTGGSWPLASSYSAMLQNPQMAFRDQELRKIAIKRDQHNQPLGMSGQFAVVYKGTFPSGRSMAVRAFTSDKGRERKDRYNVISAHIRQHRVRSLVDFEYHEKGIRASNGKMYPLLTMEWVPGVILFDWVRTKCLGREKLILRQAVDRWLELVAELNAAQVAHGDLQQANVMVTEQGEFKLVDYDCMCVPALVGRPNLEIGVAPYQHPQRNSDTLLSPDLDNFSAIFILVVLRALAAEPELWDEYVEQKKYDKLLIQPQDFADPGNSSLYQRLLKSPDPDVGRQTQELFALYRGPIERVPLLKHFIFSYDQVAMLLGQKAWDQVVELLSRLPAASNVPPQLQAGIQEARARVNCRKELEKKVAAGDEAGMKQWCQPRLLDDYPAAQPAVEVAKFAGQVVQLLQQLQQTKQRQQWPELVRLWDSQRALLESRRSPQVQAYRAEVEAWRQRFQLWRQVAGLLAQKAWDQAVELFRRCGAANEAPADVQAGIKEASTRIHCRQELEKRVAAGDEAGMQQWYQPQLLNDYPAARPAVAVAKDAGQVLQLLQQLQQAKQRQQGRLLVRIWDSQRALLESRQSPQVQAFRGEADDWRQRNLLCDRVLALAGQAAGNVEELARLWADLKLQGGHADAVARQVEIEHVIQRGRAWAAVEEWLPDVQVAPDEAKDRRLKGLWKQDLFKDWGPAEAQREAVQAAEARLEIVERLQDLLRRARRSSVSGSDDEQRRDAEIRQLSAKLPKGYEHVLQEDVQVSQERENAFQSLKRFLAADGPDTNIAAAGEKLFKLNGRSRLNPRQIERVERAAKRAPAIRRVKAISLRQRIEHRDRQLLDCWDERLLQDCAEVEPWRAAHQEAVQRQQALQALEVAIATGNDVGIVIAASEACLQSYPLRDDWQNRIQAAQARLQDARGLLRTLETGDREEFGKLFDARIIRAYGSMFRPVQDQLLQWSREDIRRVETIQLCKPVACEGLVRQGTTNDYLARWRFPEARYTDQCFLGVCRQPPTLDLDPREQAKEERPIWEPINREAHRLSGGGRKLHLRDSGDCHVAVWAVIDLGEFGRLLSEPFTLGSIDSADKKKKRAKAGW